MDVNQINVYLERAREIIGDRSQTEIDYDNEVIAHLGRGMNIKKAIAAANQKHPEEALEPDADQWADLAVTLPLHHGAQGHSQETWHERIGSDSNA